MAHCSGNAGPHARLTEISFRSKAHWGYPESCFHIWRDELTITRDYVERNEVFTCNLGEDLVAYYSIVHAPAEFRTGDLVVRAATGSSTSSWSPNSSGTAWDAR